MIWDKYHNHIKVIILIILFVGMPIYVTWRSFTCQYARSQGAPIIHALEEFYTVHDRYPDSLEVLELKDIHPDWYYVVLRNNQEYSLNWLQEHWIWDDIGFSSITDSWQFN